jgi:hypothetical protein
MITNGILITAFAFGQDHPHLSFGIGRGFIGAAISTGSLRHHSAWIAPAKPLIMSAKSAARQFPFKMRARLFFAVLAHYTRASFAQLWFGLVDVPAGAGRSAVSCSAE